MWYLTVDGGPHWSHALNTFEYLDQTRSDSSIYGILTKPCVEGEDLLKRLSIQAIFAARFRDHFQVWRSMP
jgi:hypothetical protein